MTAVIEYLYAKAQELRALIASAPEISDDLRRMAQELEELAAELASENG